MTPADTTTVQRDGLALVMAAMRCDHDAMAQLLTTSTSEDLLHLAVFCAQFAATTCHEQQRQNPGRDIEHALRAVALQLATEGTTA